VYLLGEQEVAPSLVAAAVMGCGEESAECFLCTEVAWTAVNVGLMWICGKAFGLSGAGIAFFGSYVFHDLMVYPIVRWLSGFRRSVANWQTGLLFLSSIAVVFCEFYVLPPLWAYGVGTVAVILSGVYSIRNLVNLISLDRMPRPMQRLFVRFNFVRSASR